MKKLALLALFPINLLAASSNYTKPIISPGESYNNWSGIAQPITEETIGADNFKNLKTLATDVIPDERGLYILADTALKTNDNIAFSDEFLLKINKKFNIKTHTSKVNFNIKFTDQLHNIVTPESKFEIVGASIFYGFLFGGLNYLALKGISLIFKKNIAKTNLLMSCSIGLATAGIALLNIQNRANRSHLYFKTIYLAQHIKSEAKVQNTTSSN